MMDWESWPLSAVGFVAVSLALLLWVVLSRRLCQSPRSRAISGNIALVVFSTSYMLVLVELLFSVFLVQSDNMGVTLAARRWADKYWLPTINSLGYRDYEPVFSDHLLVVVGASFVAGGGIERLQDRMSAVLGRKLGPRWTVATVANAGWDSTKKFDALSAYPKTPDVIIVSDFLYDLDRAAAKHGLHTPQYAVDPSPFLKPLVDRSSLANWIYWRSSGRGLYEKYWSFVSSAYASPEIFADYLADLLKFIDYADKIHARLYFLVWPTLANVDASDELIGKVSGALKSHGAEIIDMSPYLKNRPLKELVVSPYDIHPNARIHAEMAEVIFQRLSQGGLKDLPDASTQ